MIKSAIIVFMILLSVTVYSATDEETKDNDKSQKFTCDGNPYCKDMRSCAEARFYLTQCGLERLDRDNDGIPCESICG